MSEQSPWGQPPPPPPGPPGPPSGPPGPPPGSWAPPSYGGGPPGPPPRKRNTAAIVAAVVGGLVVVAAIVATLVVTTGDDTETASDSSSSSAPSEGASTEPSDETESAEPTDPTESAEPSDEPTAEPSTDVPPEAIVGDGYYFELPGVGWEDALEEALARSEASELGAAIDAFIILGSSLDLAQSNILVEALSAGGAPDVEALEGQWRRNLSGQDGAVPEDLPEISLDGERAIGVRFTERVNVNGVAIDQVVYLALHDGNQYSIALSLPSAGDNVSEADFETLLDSWTWTR